MFSRFVSSALLATAVGLTSPALARTKNPTSVSPEKLMTDVSQGKDLYATFDTSMGTIVVKPFSKDAPNTVENFVGFQPLAPRSLDRPQDQRHHEGQAPLRRHRFPPRHSEFHDPGR